MCTEMKSKNSGSSLCCLMKPRSYKKDVTNLLCMTTRAIQLHINRVGRVHLPNKLRSVLVYPHTRTYYRDQLQEKYTIKKIKTV